MADVMSILIVLVKSSWRPRQKSPKGIVTLRRLWKGRKNVLGVAPGWTAYRVPLLVRRSLRSEAGAGGSADRPCPGS